MDQIEGPCELERKIEQASRIASRITHQTTLQRLREYVEELRQRLRQRLAARRTKEEIRARARELWEHHGRPADRDLWSSMATGLQATVHLEAITQSDLANSFAFKDDGIIPNNAHWPFVFYRGVVALPHDLDPAAILENLFELNSWGDSWRNGIYDHVHYHSRIHEVLGIARGKGTVRFGGNNGRIFHLKAGDVAILPAGTGHQCLAASSDFLVVGAYPPTGTYDECTKSEDHRQALKTIPKVGRPRKDPVYGTKGPLLSVWRPFK